MEGAAPDLTDVALTMELVSPASAEQREALHRTWLERCPIYLAIIKPNNVTVRSSQPA